MGKTKCSRMFVHKSSNYIPWTSRFCNLWRRNDANAKEIKEQYKNNEIQTFTKATGHLIPVKWLKGSSTQHKLSILELFQLENSF